VANLDIGLTARELNPGIRMVLRTFDDTLAERFASTLKQPAISTSHTAVHVFVAAATRDRPQRVLLVPARGRADSHGRSR
jgi:voltage-gated potassium channel